MGQSAWVLPWGEGQKRVAAAGSHTTTTAQQPKISAALVPPVPSFIPT